MQCSGRFKTVISNESIVLGGCAAFGQSSEEDAVDGIGGRTGRFQY